MSKKKKIDPKYIGVPNICFSLTHIDDDREKKFVEQRKKRGFDESETWSLDCTIAEFVIPRLEEYLEIVQGVIVLEKNYVKNVNKILRAMRLIVRDDGSQMWDENETKQVRKGLKLFSQLFLTFGW